jgi:hypothetical protein
LIIRVSLLLILASLPLFLSAELLLWLAMPGFADAFVMLGTIALLSAFSVLIVTGLLGVLKTAAKSVLGYFSAEQRARRRLWFGLARQEQVERLFFFKTEQIKYFNELNRKRLLMRNNRKHVRLLSASIDKDLLSVKTKLPKATYLQLQQKIARYRKQQNVDALLALQQEISKIV